MKFPSRKITDLSVDSSLAISDLRVAAVLVFVILNLAVFFMRAISVWHYGALFTQGSEASVIYPVWKAIHHLQIYDWPLKFPFSLSLYNYLFYYTYSSFLKLIGVGGAGILTWGSLFTVVFAIIGAIAQWKLVQNYLNLRGFRSILSFAFALSLWLCTSMVRQNAFSIRADLAASAMVMIALWAIVRQPRYGFACAGLSFYLAWSFKQSFVLAFIGVCLFLLFQKQWRNLSVLIVVFAALTAMTLFLGTPEYRYNILIAPRIMSVFSFTHAVSIASKAIIANAYWILAPIPLLLVATQRREDRAFRVLTFVFVVALLGGLAGMARVGAAGNYILEAFVAGSTLLQIAVFTAPRRLVDVLLLYGCLLPAIQIAWMPSGVYPHTFGTVGLATPADYAEAVALRERLGQMKKPIFTTNSIFSLPWFSTDNRAPALAIDHIFHDATWASCQNGCIEGMLQRGDIPTVMLLSNGDPYQSSLSPNYEKTAEAPYSGKQWSIYVFNPRARRSQ